VVKRRERREKREGRREKKRITKNRPFIIHHSTFSIPPIPNVGR